ncbi:MAG: ABC transporter-related protein [Candidatus Nomurabacteria bacterium GW2011_GWC2_41_8]|uniref:ABC transporter ATP-binding protein n=3 Tax=Candidatus Nomuraibacteriota TaxID=1752729 RepID=A0A1F6YA91_9BACT|nr:MAG: ABC transporter-related protein [Candidatus Nomurabacteria bacterium GW2011_GWA2_41_25]KKS23701.1 MAG: ABC transporter-related protein [Candidatus Nomurabacteria bacterium GW2011_GWC2_41_8]OGI66566.1 MAG: hypothetical protein A2823_00405 [Candidatus Nomurabacteria bacterium RIFCSPHIGHO2_01_FULL_41_91]OGI80710.1 MAG: hypothetical protein A3D43_02440 [Candidatus Nomurabacteria bacterium RIFCSPHIGHO2_02_FULL_41_52]OGI84612.1 MAG: hypothetical protein A3F49_02115 [Candidatus Nomurabacteria 
MFNFKDSFSYIWPTISKYKWQFYGIFLLYAARPLLSNTVVPIFYKKIVDLVANTNIDRHVLADSLFHYVAFIAFTFIIANVLVRFGQFMLSEFQSNVMRDLDNLAFSKLQNHSYLFFADNFSGSLVNKTKKFVKSFESMHDMAIDNFWNPLVAFVAIFIVFFIQSPPIAYVFLGIYSIYVFIAVFLSKRKIRYYIEKADADSRITGYLADALTNILSTKSSSASMREIDRFGEATEEVHFLRLRAWNFSNRQLIVQSVLTVSVQIICLFLAVELWISGKITAGMFVLIQSYSITIGNYFWDLGRALVKFTEASSDMKEMVDIFKRTPDVLDLPRPEKCRIKDGNIEINNIDFQYEGNVEVFHNFSLSIKKGEKVGLVGHSGGGKSTITKLLMRFVDITSGEILIDGQDIRKITQDNLRKHISYISQEPILFHRSIRDNIAYSKPNASEGEIIDVAKKAHAHEFISKLPHGYDTLVGERGIKLSGGERQRVAIARAMLKDSPILMLDEATSSLDSVSEHYIQDAFNELMKGKTTIVIAHRLSTIQKMDRIIVLDKGQIVEEGTHKELLEKNGMYANLWNHQTGGFLD